MADDYETEPIIMKHDDGPVQEVEDSGDELDNGPPQKTAPRIVRQKPVIVVANPRGARLTRDKPPRPQRSYEPPNDYDTQVPEMANDDLAEAQRTWDDTKKKVEQHDRERHDEDMQSALYAGMILGATVALGASYLLYRAFAAPEKVAAVAPAIEPIAKAKVPRVRLQ